MKWYATMLGVMLSAAPTKSAEQTGQINGKTEITLSQQEVLKKQLYNVGLVNFCNHSGLIADIAGQTKTVYACAVNVDRAIACYNDYARENSQNQMTDGCKAIIFGALLHNRADVLSFLEQKKFYNTTDMCSGGS